MIRSVFILLIFTYFFVEKPNLTFGKGCCGALNNLKNFILNSFVKVKNNILNFYEEKIKNKIKKVCYNHGQKTGDENKGDLRVRNSNKQLMESQMLTPELISIHGYRPETHTVQTIDGYLLTLHRVCPMFKEPLKIEEKVILLHHGLLGSSADWILLGVDKALPYLLLNKGYDVWLANARGNIYSRDHINKTTDSPEYWDFSWDEIGQLDLSATIDYILNVTHRRANLNFIGHSMGGTALIVLLSTAPKYNYVLKSVILLAPLAFMYHVKGPLRYFSNIMNLYNSSFISKEIDDVFAKMLNKADVEKLCEGVDNVLCGNPLMFLTNTIEKMSNRDITSAILKHVPAGGSMKSLIHYCQLVKSGGFHPFDTGSTMKNIKRFGRISPPSYDINQVIAPIAIFSSTDDYLSTIEDTVTLIRNFSNVILHHIVRNNDFSHTDFVFADDSPELVYNLVLQLLDKTQGRFY